jgi:hypothetical protein
MIVVEGIGRKWEYEKSWAESESILELRDVIGNHCVGCQDSVSALEFNEEDQKIRDVPERVSEHGEREEEDRSSGVGLMGPRT